jgi:hypothetical protein
MTRPGTSPARDLAHCPAIQDLFVASAGKYKKDGNVVWAADE